MNGPCPTCGQTDGFHEDTAHAEARARVPSELFKPKGWVMAFDWGVDQRAHKLNANVALIGAPDAGKSTVVSATGADTSTQEPVFDGMGGTDG